MVIVSVNGNCDTSSNCLSQSQSATFCLQIIQLVSFTFSQVSEYCANCNRGITVDGISSKSKTTFCIIPSPQQDLGAHIPPPSEHSSPTPTNSITN